MKPVPFCIACRQAAVGCQCKGSPPGLNVSFALGGPTQPEDPDELLDRWTVLVRLQPIARQLDVARFVAEYKKQGLVAAFERLKPRLTAMAAEYNLEGPDGRKLIEVFREFGEYTEEKLRGEVEAAMAAFLGLRWSTLTNFGLSMINNAFQSGCTLRPERYPRADSDLKMAAEVLNVLMAVNDLASPRMDYSLECTLVLTQ